MTRGKGGGERRGGENGSERMAGVICAFVVLKFSYTGLPMQQKDESFSDKEYASCQSIRDILNQGFLYFLSFPAIKF